MKNLFTFLCIISLPFVISAQTKLIENFDYTAGDSIGAHGWISNSGGSTNRILVTSPGLIYDEYPLSDTGNACSLQSTGQDEYKPLTSNVNSGSAYASFMVNVSAAERPGDYFAAFLPSTSPTFYSCRVYARNVAGLLEFGLTKASLLDTSGMSWASGFLFNTTYLIVLKYTFNAGPNNDQVSMFIFQSGLPIAEPLPNIGPVTFSGTSGDANNLGRFALRQGASGRAPTLTIDGILVSTDWFTTINFYQLNQNFNGAIQTNSDWGRIEITHTGYKGDKYLNLAINTPGITTQWQVVNAYLENSKDMGESQKQVFHFDIGDTGVDVTSIQYGILISDFPQFIAPPVNSIAVVNDFDLIIYNGLSSASGLAPVNNSLTSMNFVSSFPFNPGIINGLAKARKHKNFPNQECKKNECVPAGVSNSLKFLKKEHMLVMNDADITIDSLKKGTDWNSTIGVSTLGWPGLKKAYMEKKNLPITTRVRNDTTFSEEYMDSLKKELANGQDVEFGIEAVNGNDTTRHLISVTSLGKSAGGQWYFTFSHDAKQDSAGGVDEDQTAFDRATNRFISSAGSTISNFNRGIIQVVVECPNNQTASMQLPADDSEINSSSAVFEWECNNCLPSNPVTYWLETATDSAFENKIIDDRNVLVDSYIPVPGTFKPGSEYFWRVRVNDSVGPGSYLDIFKFYTSFGASVVFTGMTEGMYHISGDSLSFTDTMKVYLREGFIPYNIVDSASASVSGNLLTGTANFTSEVTGNYYIVVKPRNGLETWSSSPQPITSEVPHYYDFTLSSSQAYGNNMKLYGTRYCFYSGEINSDGSIDLNDMLAVFNDAVIFTTGYVITDLNGDYNTDLSDLLIVFNNSSNFVSTKRP